MAADVEEVLDLPNLLDTDLFAGLLLALFGDTPLLVAFRRRRQILAWWQARRQSSPALARDESLSSAP